MSKYRWSILAVAVGLVVAFAAVAQEHGSRQGQSNQTFTERYGQQLNLTDAQKTQIDELDKKFKSDNAAFLDSYQQTMNEYRDARQANDKAKLDALRPKVDSLRADMMKLRTAHEEKIATTFNDEQKATWKKIQADRDARMKEREQHQ